MIRGPYCTGAVTPCGAAAPVVVPHPQRREMSWCSTTRTRQGWQVEHLAAFHPHLDSVGEVRAAARARARLVPAPLVRVGDQRQRRPRMTRLPTRLTAAAAAQRLRRRLGERRVRRRRLRRVGRVHPQPALQLGVLGLQRGHPRPKLGDHPRLLGDQGGELVIRRTPLPSLHPMIIASRRSSPRRRPDQLRLNSMLQLRVSLLYFSQVMMRAGQRQLAICKREAVRT